MTAKDFEFLTGTREALRAMQPAIDQMAASSLLRGVAETVAAFDKLAATRQLGQLGISKAALEMTASVAKAEAAFADKIGRACQIDCRHLEMSSGFEEAGEALRSLAARPTALETFAPGPSIVEALSTIHDSAAAAHALLDDRLTPVRDALDSQRKLFASAAEALDMSRHVMAGFDFGTVGSAVALAPWLHDDLAAGYLRLGKSVEHLFATLEAEQALAHVPPFVIEAPPRALYAHTVFLKSISVWPEARRRPPLDWLDDEAVVAALESVDPDLMRHWLGATEALLSGNPERMSHTGTSIRRLLGRLLDRLAPRAEAWPRFRRSRRGGPRDEHRMERAQVLYCTRHVACPPYSLFLVADVEQTIRLFRTCNEAIHEELTEERAEDLIRVAAEQIVALVRSARYRAN